MSLPDGWAEAQDPSGRTYYYNQNTDETSWELPQGTPPSSTETEVWKELQGDEGTFYFWNEATNETRWEEPTGPGLVIERLNSGAASASNSAPPRKPPGPAPVPRAKQISADPAASLGTPVPVSTNDPAAPALDAHGSTAAPGSASGDPLFMQGYMTKEGHVRKNWKRRWFVLQDQTLKYFANMGDEQPAGEIQMSGAKIEDAPQKKKGDNCFGIIQTPKSLFIVADNQNERDSWKEMLQQSAGLG